LRYWGKDCDDERQGQRAEQAQPTVRNGTGKQRVISLGRHKGTPQSIALTPASLS
jgi:hypothetical protein